MSNIIHPTAIIEDGAQLGNDVIVGAYAYVGSLTSIGNGCHIHHHATVDGKTRLGVGNIIHPYAYIGAPTHDLKYIGGIPGLVIGSNNTFREYCTIHTATNDGDNTLIGNNNVFLAYAHVGHDCVVGDHVIMSSQAALGGHVVLHDFTNIGWQAGVHQFCKIGKYSMVGASSKATQDIPPYMLADGNPAKVRSLNLVNLQRRNFSDHQISQIKKIFKIFYLRGLNRTQAIDEMKLSDIASEFQNDFMNFLHTSTRGFA
jgi:UDP-N-acetylglucosamine acyltransferase